MLVHTDIRNFNQYKFDENEYADKPGHEYKAKQKKEKIEARNINDCMNNCALQCQSKLSSLVRGVRGYYVCDNATYKLTNVKCVIDKKFIKAKSVLVFDDIAEIQTSSDSIVFIRDTNDKKDFVYIGKYDNDTVYLKVKNKRIYVGRKSYSMEECL